MYNPACVVNLHLHHPPPRRSPQPAKTTSPRAPEGTCCGILIDTEGGLVLAHASCLGPLLERGDLDLDHDTLSLTLKEDWRCEVLLQRKEEGRGSERQVGERVSGVLVSTVPGVDTSSPHTPHVDELSDEDGGVSGRRGLSESKVIITPRAFERFPSTVVHLFHCPRLRESLESLMPDPAWELLDRKDVKADNNNNSINNNNNSSNSHKSWEADEQRLLSCFIVIRLQQWQPYISPLPIRSTTDCAVGETVEVCSTPFGGLKAQAFFNSYSRGVVSNLAGKDNCLLLSDARCILGGEGAPLYTFHRHGSSSVRCVTGVIVASLCWKNQEWVGFCVACDIAAVLQSAPTVLRHLHRDRYGLVSPLPQPLTGRLASHGVPSPEVVMIKVGSTWGSGVVVEADTGVILTCSHVIKEAHLYPVEVQRGRVKGEGGRTRVLYRQHPVVQQFDLAVVQAAPPSSTDLPHPPPPSPLTVAEPVEGTEVFVVGHALFGAEHHLPPSVTSGVISKVIRVNRVPVMIQTTCAVHPGASGGALVDTKGHLLAIVVCNTRDNSSGASFPHLNMSIPVCAVWPVITRFLRTRDARHLERLRLANSAVDTIWSLGFTQDTGMSPKASKL
ncbi:peroxisomal leader peptide-processing protease-like [Babylonia areolata]|uniref:peroxisomal leader peptide-processing protease-like n=1 Tax=Babylonia areolata TaxID=304850 RepID=UPI003FD02E5A